MGKANGAKGPQHFKVSTKDGGLASVKGPARGATRVYPVERVLESLVALNPNLIGVERELPLLYHGGEEQPDLHYLSRGGRQTFVEFKRRTATGMDLMQLCSYAYHYGALSAGQLGALFVGTATRARGLVDAHLYVVTHGAPKDTDSPLEVTNPSPFQERTAWVRRRLPRKAGSAAARRLAHSGAAVWELGETLEEAARELWGDETLPLVGAPPRMVLVAPEFDEQCSALAAEMVSRCVQLELVQLVTYGEAGGAVKSVEYARLHRQQHMEHLYELACDLLQIPEVNDRWSLDRWFIYTRGVMDRQLRLSLDDDPELKLWLYASVGTTSGKVREVKVSFTMADGWKETPNAARRRAHSAARDLGLGSRRDVEVLPRSKIRQLKRVRDIAVLLANAYSGGSP